MSTLIVRIDETGRKLHPEVPIFLTAAQVSRLRVVVEGGDFMELGAFRETYRLLIAATHLRERCELSFEQRGTELSCDVDVSTLSPGLYVFSLRNVTGRIVINDLVLSRQNDFYVTVNPPIADEGISMCTVYTHALGPLKEWGETIGPLIDGGMCNMIHFTPINKLGSSSSCYSLASWTAWQPSVQSEEHLKRFTTEHLYAKGAHAMYDIVLNHISPDAPMLQQLRSASFNTADYAYLLPAALLDLHMRAIEAAVLRTGWDARGTGVVPPERFISRNKSFFPLLNLISPREREVLSLYNLRCCYWEADGQIGIKHDQASEFCHTLTTLVGRVFDALRLHEYELLDMEENSQEFVDRLSLLPSAKAREVLTFLYETVLPEYERFTIVTGTRKGARICFDRIFRRLGLTSAMTCSGRLRNNPDGSLDNSIICLNTGKGDSNVSCTFSDDEETPAPTLDKEANLKAVLDELAKQAQHDSHCEHCQGKEEDHLTTAELQEMFQYFFSAFERRVQERNVADRASILQAVGSGVWYRLFVDIKPAFKAFCFSDAPAFDIFLRGFQPIIDANDGDRRHHHLTAALETDPSAVLARVENGEIICSACNGWVMGTPYDFTRRVARAYLRCSVVTWGDCIKLAYYLPSGLPNKRLWTLATSYVRRCAEIFDSIRIDNAHSTDPRLLRHVINAARTVRQDIYVMLECFMGNAMAEARFLQEVGGNSVVNELINAASIGQLCETAVYGGEVIGRVRDTVRLRIPALMFDVTHDNIPPGSEYSLHERDNLLILSAVAAANCLGGMATTHLVGTGAIGKLCVAEKALYKELAASLPPRTVRYATCATLVKSILTELHCTIASGGYSQVYAQSHHDKLMTIERMHPTTGESYVFVLRPAFKYNNGGPLGEIGIDFLGTYSAPYVLYNPHQLPQTIEGLTPDHVPFPLQVQDANRFTVYFTDETFPRGSIFVFTKKTDAAYEGIMRLTVSDASVTTFRAAFQELNPFLQKCFLTQVAEDEGDYIQQAPYLFSNDRGYLLPSYSGFDGVRDALFVSDVSGPVAENIRCDNWLVDYIIARDEKYFQRHCVDAGEPVETRNRMRTALESFHAHVRLVKQVPMSLRPRCLRHIYAVYDQAINQAILFKEGFITKDSSLGKLTNLHEAVCYLYRASLTLIGFEPETANVDLRYVCLLLDILGQSEGFRGSSVLETLRDTIYDPNLRENNVSLCAGYPHFFRGLFRSWGRDSALAITGCMTIFPSRRLLARQILVTTFSLLRHGLLPNLQDSGRRPRYNARDAVWFMLSSLLDYIHYTKDVEILDQDIVRLFPSDSLDDYELVNGYYVLRDLINNYGSEITSRYVMPLKHVILEILTRHLRGISFREWNAGPAIDEQMRYEGFNVDVHVDEATGLIVGGNPSNCGTWMDKMGSCDWINKGCPGSSRHGANVEINLCCLVVLKAIIANPAAFGVVNAPAKVAGLKTITMEELRAWELKLEGSLNDEFLSRVEHRPSRARMLRDTITPDLLTRFEKVKDQKLLKMAPLDPQATYFRPNYFIGLSFSKDEKALAKQFTKEIEDGLRELHTATMEHKYLVTARREAEAGNHGFAARDPVPWHMVGMRTIHHLDSAFRTYYDMNDRSSYETAGGLCYHNGPAWPHVYARAITSAILSGYKEPEHLFINLIHFLGRHSNVNGSFKSIPELQQGDGTFCSASCTNQAWAVGGFLEALYLLLQGRTS
ncbi:Amylo-alpha-1,6-glucosidase [Giardia muris]|uniref:Amylo-alpha-1,6-glucosidase n=1 Tax=Giardia muris TaxID=5742 RepID=A0A4Z1SSC2_GIAMU|nr:Amylo-alpha-1,6-glucosidase [Giardia muris]|eukprot:TNJ28796.1 Amylo-alpha-1,6-glucosidase [Giardia muris]